MLSARARTEAMFDPAFVRLSIIALPNVIILGVDLRHPIDTYKFPGPGSTAAGLKISEEIQRSYGGTFQFCTWVGTC
jgi:hypothetical protein